MKLTGISKDFLLKKWALYAIKYDIYIQVTTITTTTATNFRRTWTLLETKLYSRNLTKRINTWGILLGRYSGPFLKWTREELKQVDKSTRKLMNLHKALRHWDDVGRLYMSKEKKKDEVLPKLKTALTHQYNDLITAYKTVEEDWLQPPETILTTWGSRERH